MEKEKQERKIVQIAAATHENESFCYALCDDGSAWVEAVNVRFIEGSKFTEYTWKRLPPIPQD